MTAEDNKSLLERYVTEVWDKGNPESAALYASEDFRRHGRPGDKPLDLAEQIERLKGFRAAFPDITIHVDEVIASDTHIAFRSTMRGTHRGALMGIQATGRQVTVQLVDMIRVEDGRFVEQWGGPDMLDLLSQLGATFHTGSFSEEE